MGQNDKATIDRAGGERRRKLRINASYPARVRGVDAEGAVFEGDTVIDNLGAGGLYLRLRQRIDQGAKLFVVVNFSLQGTDGAAAPVVAILGEVLRAEPQVDGRYGVAVGLTRFRFL